MVSKPTRHLVLRNIKINIIETSFLLRDNKIMAHTHNNGAIWCAFSPEHAGINIVMLRRKMVELWRFEDFLFIHIFMNFDKLNINYELILSKIY